MRTTPTWLTISMLAGVFSWRCYEHARRVAAESSVVTASAACDSTEDSADEEAPAADDRDDDDDTQGVTIVEVTTTGAQGSTQIVRIQ